MLCSKLLWGEIICSLGEKKRGEQNRKQSVREMWNTPPAVLFFHQFNRWGVYTSLCSHQDPMNLGQVRTRQFVFRPCWFQSESDKLRKWELVPITWVMEPTPAIPAGLTNKVACVPGTHLMKRSETSFGRVCILQEGRTRFIYQLGLLSSNPP